jgi:hypothetical protein
MKQNILTTFSLLTEIITAARTGDYGNAASKLNKILQLTQEILANSRINAQGIKKLTYSLETLFALQQTGDWVAFADILEFELTPLWKELTSDI